MTSFSCDWLALREPADHAARDASLVDALVGWLDGRPARRIVDLGCGTGSNLRYLLPRLGEGQRWRLVDHDRALLDRIPALLDAWCADRGYACRVTGDGTSVRGDGVSAIVTTEALDLSAGLAPLALQDVDLISASALLDLCSAAWIDGLAEACAAASGGAGAAGLFVLDYDGTADWDPAHPADAEIRDRINRHQLGDKGFGPALGPGAAAYVADRFVRLGHDVRDAASPWRIGAGQHRLHAAYVDGWAGAAAEAGSGTAASGATDTDLVVAEWREHRLGAAHHDATRLVVGHRDVLGLPGGG